jgi:aminoglycoside 6'-N-acetyltransferase
MQADWRFRPMLEVDFERQWRWLNQPHVNRWWSRRPVSRDDVRAKYLPRIRGEEPTHCLVALLDATPSGYVQAYRIADYAEFASGFVLPAGGWGFDWFIGEPKSTGEGQGARLLEAFVSTWLWPRRDVVYAVVGSSADNAAALNSYERAGFEPWFSTLPQASAERYYRRDRHAGEGWSKRRT